MHTPLHTLLHAKPHPFALAHVETSTLYSEEDMARPTVAMWVLFQVLLSTMTVRLDIADVW